MMKKSEEITKERREVEAEIHGLEEKLTKLHEKYKITGKGGILER